MAPRVGDPAPDFELSGTGGATFRLADQRGHVVVLAFYPGDDTPVCTRQLSAYNSDLGDFSDLGAVLWGISPQGVASHDAFSCKHGFDFPLLADVDKAVAASYGVLGPLGFYRRSVFVIDGGGIIRYAKRSFTGLRFEPTAALLAAVAGAGGTRPGPR